jgi:hypothetical protein
VAITTSTVITLVAPEDDLVATSLAGKVNQAGKKKKNWYCC